MTLHETLSQPLYGIEYGYVIVGVLVLGVVASLAVWLIKRWLPDVSDQVDELTARSRRDPGDGDLVEIAPPDIDAGLLGFMAMWRHRRREKRLARKGYIKWHKIGATRSRPKWVNPAHDGAGEPEYYDSDEDVTYLFPEDAMVPDERTGAWVAEHRVGEAEPINLRDPGMPALDADRLEEVINLEAESDAPGFFDRFDMDTQTMMWMGIGVMFVVYAGFRYMG